MLQEFDLSCILNKSQIKKNFNARLTPLVKLWINKVDREQLSWDKWVKAVNKAKTKALIHNLKDFDQNCL